MKETFNQTVNFGRCSEKTAKTQVNRVIWTALNKGRLFRSRPARVPTVTSPSHRDQMKPHQLGRVEAGLGHVSVVDFAVGDKRSFQPGRNATHTSNRNKTSIDLMLVNGKVLVVDSNRDVRLSGHSEITAGKRLVVWRPPGLHSRLLKVS